MEMSDRIGRRLKLNDLHVLMTVVKAGSMNKAAGVLRKHDPARRRYIDRGIGTDRSARAIAHRGPQGVVPTVFGRALLDGGAAVFDDLRQTLKNIEFLADPTAGEVRIGCNPFLAATLVLAVVDRLSRRYPRVVFHLVTASVETQHRELSERNVDLLITRTSSPVVDNKLEDDEFLFEDLFFVAAGAQSLVGSATQDRACRVGERIVGTATAGKRAWLGGSGNFLFQRSRLSPNDCGRHARRCKDKSPGHRALSFYFPGFRITISYHACTTQASAC